MEKKIFEDLPNKKYKIIYADPPWSYNDKLNLQNEGASLHYKTLSLEELKSLDINSICDKDCILFLWVTRPMMPVAIELVKAWGFKYKTIAFTWVKTNPKSKTYFKGIGRWVMGCTESVILATKGKPQRVVKNIHELVVSSRSKHSKKPNEVRELIVKLMGDKSRIELFAREKVEGWDSWGNEI